MTASETRTAQGGALYVVATPIGNLEDITIRAAQTLAQASVIAAEDTRHTRILLDHLGIARPRLMALHEHNETRQIPSVLRMLHEGAQVALVSDAGTPLISDPGYRLVSTAREQGLNVFTIPGPSAVTAALSVSGLPTDRFVFEGFLPGRATARRARLETLSHDTRTLVLFESPRRIRDTIDDVSMIFGADRPLALCRELTKRFESVRRGSAAQVAAILQHDTRARLADLSMPTLVISGDADVIVPVENSRALLELLPRPKLVVLPRVGHALNHESPEAVGVALRSFLLEPAATTATP